MSQQQESFETMTETQKSGTTTPLETFPVESTSETPTESKVVFFGFILRQTFPEVPEEEIFETMSMMLKCKDKFVELMTMVAMAQSESKLSNEQFFETMKTLIKKTSQSEPKNSFFPEEETVLSEGTQPDFTKSFSSLGIPPISESAFMEMMGASFEKDQQ